MMNVLIIEDEESAYDNLRHILTKIDASINIVTRLQSVEQSIKWFNENAEPDIIFLDIQLSDDLSFKIFESVSVTCPIVFTTAFDEYAIKAFELNSIDYILKPITRHNVNKALTKYQSHVKPATSPYDKLLTDIKNISSQNNYKERFLANKGDELVIIPTKDIAYFYKGTNTTIVLKNGDKYPAKFTLDQLIESLNPTQFYRVNRQFIISIEAITKITFWFKGKLKLQLTPTLNESIYVSREKATDFKNWMNK